MRYNGIRKKTFDFRERRPNRRVSSWLHTTSKTAVCPKCSKVGILSHTGKEIDHVISAWKNAKTGRAMGYELFERCILWAVTMNRLEAVNKFYEEHPIDPIYVAEVGRKPPFIYGHAHVVIEDSNIEDYWIYLAISDIAYALAEERNEFDQPPDQAQTLLKFLVSLLDLPLPDGWEDDE